MVELMLCVNHPENGEPSGKLYQLSLSDPDALTLESPYADRFLRCTIGDSFFRIGKMMWMQWGWCRWVGSWCWDQVVVEPACAADVINYVVGKGYTYSVASGSILLAIKAKRPLTVCDLLSGR